MTPRNFLFYCLTTLLLVVSPPAAVAQQPQRYAVVVYGATPAGIAAAIAASDGGTDVLLVEPTRRIGGLTTNGLSHADFRTFAGLTGMFWKFTQLVDDHYRQTYGDDSPQVQASFGGTQGEPSINLMVFQQMLDSRPSITVVSEQRLEAVDTAGGVITGMSFADVSGGDGLSVTPDVCIDASYEGDLMAAAGVPYHVGRESRQRYGESLAPEQEDDQLQGYNFRLIMTTDADNRVMPEPPPGYDRELFTGVLAILESGQIDSVFGYPSRCIIKAHTPGLPNDKYDINDVSRGLVRLSLPSENRQWPGGDGPTRQRIFDAHRLWNEGLIYFLQNDEAVPQRFRADARRWGWCRDEFLENDHLPVQLYVREARRMIGTHVYIQDDVEANPGDVRSRWHGDAIAMGDYGPNCHGTGRQGTRFDGEHTGEFYHRVAPYQIPYGVLTPDLDRPGGIRNLLVPGAVSSSHVGFCALRLEPIWTSLGQAAGHAAGLALRAEIAVQAVPVDQLQDALHADGAATIYLSDIAPGDADFALAQWWGTRGGFHNLVERSGRYGQRGPNIVGQYFAPYPDHAADLDRPLDPATFHHWREVARRSRFTAAQIPPRTPELTRRQWLRALSKHRDR